MNQCKTLFISNRNDVTTDYLISKFKEYSSDFLRIDSEDINLIDIEYNDKHGTLVSIDDSTYELSQVKSAYYRRAPTTFASVEDELDKPYLYNERRHFFEGIYLGINGCKWINPIFKTYSGERKLMQLSLAKRIGLHIPETIVTNKLIKAKEFISKNRDCIVKPISHGLQQRDNSFYSIYTTPVNSQQFTELQLTETFDTPIFLQKQVPNKLDIRVTIVGEKIFSVSIEKNNSEEVDWRKPSIEKTYREHKLPKIISDKLITINNQLGLIYSAIDLILQPNGQYVFLEVNPVGEWGWIEKEVGCEITTTLINELLCLQ